MVESGDANRISPKEIIRQRLIKEMFQCTDEMKIIVVDNITVKILSILFSYSEVMMYNVLLFERLELKRKEFPDYHAIYFVHPTPETMMRVYVDFVDKKKPLYKAAHMFFTSPTTSLIMEKCTKQPISKFIQTLKVFPMEFILPEESIFHVDMRHSFFTLYKQLDKANSREQEQRTDDLLKQMAKKLAAVCIAINEVPQIRYLKVADRRLNLTEKLAYFTQSAVQEALSAMTFTNQNISPNRNRATLLILDRSHDPITPILHEFTYQAMVNDLLEGQIQDGRIFRYTYVGKPEDVILNEEDPIWLSTRHTHIAEVIDSVTLRFKEFKANNKAAAYQLAQSASGGSISSLNDSEKKKDLDFSASNTLQEKVGSDPSGTNLTMQLADMKATVSSIGEYKKLVLKFSAHLSMATTCMQKFNVDRLSSAASNEQTMATGSTATGSSMVFSKVLTDLVPLLTDANLSSNCKVRLLALFFLQSKAKDMEESEKKKLIQTARLTQIHERALTSLLSFGVDLLSTDQKGSKASLLPINPSLLATGFGTKLVKKDQKASSILKGLLKKRKGDGANAEDKIPYELSRYIPPLRLILQELSEGTLCEEVYPKVGESDELTKAMHKMTIGNLDGNSRSSSPGPGTAFDYRMGARSLRLRPTKKKVAAAGQQFPPSIIVFVIGGITYSEIRVIYEHMSSNYSTAQSSASILGSGIGQVLFGGTHILTPSQFLQDLGTLRDPYSSITKNE